MPKGSILVIDDEAEIREGLELLLKTEGYQVSMADSGQSGLLRLGEKPYDLLLLRVIIVARILLFVVGLGLGGGQRAFGHYQH